MTFKKEITRNNNLISVKNMFPFGKTKLFISFLCPLLILVASVTAFHSCANSSSCGKHAFQNSIWGEALELPEFCEQDNENSILRERWNSLSSFVYLYFALVIMFTAAFDWIYINLSNEVLDNKFVCYLMYNPLLSFVYGITLSYVGFGSFVFHAYGSETAARHDRVAILIHLCVLFVLCRLLYRPFNPHTIPTRQTLIILLVLMMLSIPFAFTVILGIVPKAGVLIIVEAAILLILVAGALYIRARDNTPLGRKPKLFILTAIVLFIAAFLLQEQYVPIKCHTESEFQTHTIWHLFTALGFFFAYLAVRADGVEPTLKEYTYSDSASTNATEDIESSSTSTGNDLDLF